MRATYYRWTRDEYGDLRADILGSDILVSAHPSSGEVSVRVPDRAISPYEARLIGVRMIEAAALADGEKAIRSKGRG